MKFEEKRKGKAQCLKIESMMYCVYFICKNKEVIYIGKTKNLINRLGCHFPYLDFDSIYYISECSL